MNLKLSYEHSTETLLSFKLWTTESTPYADEIIYVLQGSVVTLFSGEVENLQVLYAQNIQDFI